jgi:hypothetical protein
MAMDLFKNFAYGMVLIPPVPPDLGTSFTVPAGQSARFPAPPFSVSVWPLGLPADPSNAEIVRVTSITNDIWQILRKQEGTQARSMLAQDQIAQALTVQALADLKADLQAWVTAQTYATQAWVNAQVFATQAWVNSQGFATQAWVNSNPQGFALQTYVDNRDNAVMGWVSANFPLFYPRIATLTSAANIYPNVDNTDIVTVNGLAETMGVQAPTGTAHEGQLLIIRIRDNGTAQVLGWASIYMSQNAYAALPGATVAYHTLHLAFRYNQLYGKWALLALTQE